MSDKDIRPEVTQASNGASKTNPITDQDVILESLKEEIQDVTLEQTPISNETEIEAPKEESGEEPKEEETPQEEPEKIGVPVSKPTSRINNIVEDIFAAYYAGDQLQDICKMFDIVPRTFYRLRDERGWVERKRRLNALAKEQVDINLVKSKAEKIKMADTIISIAGASIIKSYKEGTLQIKFGDYLAAMRAYALLVGENNMTQTNIHINNQMPVQSKEALIEIANAMTPQERGLIVEINKKMAKMSNDAEKEKLRLLE